MKTLQDADHYLARLEQRTAALERDKRYEHRKSSSWTIPGCFAVFFAPWTETFIIGRMLHKFSTKAKLGKFLTNGHDERLYGVSGFNVTSCMLAFVVGNFRCYFDWLRNATAQFWEPRTLYNLFGMPDGDGIIPPSVSAEGDIGSVEIFPGDYRPLFQIADPFSDAVTASGNYEIETLSPSLELKYGIPYRLSNGNILSLHANNFQLCDSRPLIAVYDSTMTSLTRVGNRAEYDGREAGSLRALTSCSTGGFWSAQQWGGFWHYSGSGVGTEILQPAYFGASVQLWSDYEYGNGVVISWDIAGTGYISRYEGTTLRWSQSHSGKTYKVRFDGLGNTAVTHVVTSGSARYYSAYVMRQYEGKVSTDYHHYGYPSYNNSDFLEMDEFGPIGLTIIDGTTPSLKIRTYSMVDGAVVQDIALDLTSLPNHGLPGSYYKKAPEDLILGWNGGKIYGLTEIGFLEWNRDGSRSMDTDGVTQKNLLIPLAGIGATIYCPINRGKDYIWIVSGYVARLQTSTWTIIFSGVLGSYTLTNPEVFTDGDALCLGTSGSNITINRIDSSTGNATTLYSADQSTIPSAYEIPPWPVSLLTSTFAITTSNNIVFGIADLRKNYVRAGLYSSAGELIGMYNAEKMLAVSTYQNFSTNAMNMNGYLSDPECVWAIENWVPYSTTYGTFRVRIYDIDVTVLSVQDFERSIYKNARTNEHNGTIVFSRLLRVYRVWDGDIYASYRYFSNFFAITPDGAVVWETSCDHDEHGVYTYEQNVFGTPSTGIAFTTLDILGTVVKVAVFGYVSVSGEKRLLFLNADTGEALYNCVVPYLTVDPNRIELHTSGAMFVSG